MEQEPGKQDNKRPKRPLWRRLLTVAAVIVVLYFGAAFVLIKLPDPSFPEGTGMTVEEAIESGMTVDQIHSFEPYQFDMRDGETLYCRRFTSDSSHTIIFVHGASGHSSQLNKSAGALRDTLEVEVFAFDLRGHGNSGGTRGDLDYIGQYTDDLAEVITAVRQLKPQGKLVLAGHSMGGGIIQMYAMSHGSEKVDGYLLFAPALGMDLKPGKQPDTEGKEFFKAHMARFLGLSMINPFGIRKFNNLPVAFLNFAPLEGHIMSYSLNGIASAFPIDYRAALAALKRPTFVVLGGSDTLGRIDAPTMSDAIQSYSQGEVFILEEEGHHPQNNPQAIQTAATWFKSITKP